MKTNSVELYASPGGERWLLHIGADERPVVRHVPNAASGGNASEMSVADFLSSDSSMSASKLRHAARVVRSDLPSCLFDIVDTKLERRQQSKLYGKQCIADTQITEACPPVPSAYEQQSGL
ncbi:hypothetical protein [Caballeronia cordobensis]|uniref:hypothetical protein n=1 Tax=Caballeronia cordobensis TaxID=1353886 RepID=UPI0005EE28C2